MIDSSHLKYLQNRTWVEVEQNLQILILKYNNIPFNMDNDLIIWIGQLSQFLATSYITEF